MTSSSTSLCAGGRDEAVVVGQKRRQLGCGSNDGGGGGGGVNNSVLLARVSLRDSLLAVTDHRGIVIFASEDCWALGVGPAALIGMSLLDLLTEEDRHEFKASMRRRCGSLLRCLSGCFIWLDITCCAPVPPKLKRALQTVERVRSTSGITITPRGFRRTLSSSSCLSRRISSNSLMRAGAIGKTALMSNNHHHHQGGSSNQSTLSIEDHILNKERTLEWFTTDEDSSSSSSSCLDRKGDVCSNKPAGAIPTRVSSTNLSLASLSLRSSQCSGLGGSTTTCEEDGVGNGMMSRDDSYNTQYACNGVRSPFHQYYHQSSSPSHKKQVKECSSSSSYHTQNGGGCNAAAAVTASCHVDGVGTSAAGMGGREYSFREIFEYLGRHSVSFHRQSSASNVCLSAGAASHHPHQNMEQPQAMTLGDCIAAKCRAPEAIEAGSWTVEGSLNLVGRAMSGGNGMSIGVGLNCTPEESGWDWYLDL